MKGKIIYLKLWLMFFSTSAIAQTAALDLSRIENRLDSIESFSAKLSLKLDITFITMPEKTANVYFEKGKPLELESSDFVMLPKKGLDVTMSELFKYPYIVVDRGYIKRNGRDYREVSVIPQDRKADFAIATLLLDIKRDRIMQSEISTKNHGTYKIDMSYDSTDSPLPSFITIAFEIQDVKLPIQYLSKNTDMAIDKKSARKEGIHDGLIYLTLTDYQINYMD